MKKYSVLFAIIALVLASLACQTVMGGSNNFQAPNVPSVTEAPQTAEKSPQFHLSRQIKVTVLRLAANLNSLCPVTPRI